MEGGPFDSLAKAAGGAAQELYNMKKMGDALKQCCSMCPADRAYGGPFGDPATEQVKGP